MMRMISKKEALEFAHWIMKKYPIAWNNMYRDYKKHKKIPHTEEKITFY